MEIDLHVHPSERSRCVHSAEAAGYISHSGQQFALIICEEVRRNLYY
jgi:hypothetical protein